MSGRPSVDVIVPSYNYGSYVEGCVASVLDNSGVDVRVLLLDDASTDETPEIGARLAARDSRVTYRRHSRNFGHIATYNEGLEWVAAEYLLLISADDLLAPGALVRAANALRRHPDAVFAHGRQITFSDPAELASIVVAPEPGILSNSGVAFIASVCENAQNPVATPTVVVRADVHRRTGGYESSLPHTADLELWLRLATEGAVLRLEALQAFKRQHGKNMQIGYIRPTEGDVLERRSAFDGFFAGPGAKLNDAAALRVKAHQALALELVWRAAAAFDARDVSTTERLLAIAAATSPTVRQTSAWRRMEFKSRIGTRAWAFVRSVTNMRQRLT